MSRPRGRPPQGKGISLPDILSAAFGLLEENGRQGLTMRSLAARLGVTPMSLYHHVEDRAALLCQMSGSAYSSVLMASDSSDAPLIQARALLIRYFDVVTRYPQLTLAIFTEPDAFAGLVCKITEQLTILLALISPEPSLWRDILLDHVHGCGLGFALSSAKGDAEYATNMSKQYQIALDRLLAQLPG